MKKEAKSFFRPPPNFGDLNFLTPKKKLTRVFCSPLVFLINQKSLNSDLKIISFALRQFFLEKNQKLSKFPAYFIIQVRQETSLNRDVMCNITRGFALSFQECILGQSLT